MSSLSHQEHSTFATALSNGFSRIDGLYLHVPFCFHKCHYCDFYSIGDKNSAQRYEAFTTALIRELARRCDAAASPRTLFVGGGTPTLLPGEQWQRLLESLRGRGLLDNLEEFTVEANPETVDAELLRLLIAGGVNRLSLGAQSFNPELLKTLERWHEPASVGRAVRLAREAGIDNINLDLIFAIPGQTIDQLNADLDALLALEPEHVSCYSLIFEPNTPLTQKLKIGRVSAVGEETERAMYQRVMHRLAAAGYQHYEISNWARQSRGATTAGSSPAPASCQSEISNLKSEITFACLHNLIYWSNANWLGLGPSAASHVDGIRWKNEPHLGRYIAGCPDPPIVDIERLSPRRRVGEQLMLALRMREGIPLDRLNDYLPADDPRHATIAELIDIHMLQRTDTHLRLTHQGLFVADSVIAKLL